MLGRVVSERRAEGLILTHLSPTMEAKRVLAACVPSDGGSGGVMRERRKGVQAQIS
jgi:hypothetical protein